MPLDCIDPDGFDAAPLFARARGETIDDAAAEALDLHLDRCPACRDLEAELVVTNAEHERRDPAEIDDTLQALLQAANGVSAASTRRMGDRGARGFIQKAWVGIGGVIAVAATVTFAVVGTQTSSAPSAPVALAKAPTLRVIGTGMTKVQMGGTPTPTRAEEVLEYAPDGNLGLVAQLERTLAADAPALHLFAFVEREGRLVRIDEDLLERGDDPTWPTLAIETPVADLLGRAPAKHRLLFGSSFVLDAAALDGRPVEAALEDARVEWRPQTVEVISVSP